MGRRGCTEASIAERLTVGENVNWAASIPIWKQHASQSNDDFRRKKAAKKGGRALARLVSIHERRSEAQKYVGKVRGADCSGSRGWQRSERQEQGKIGEKSRSRYRKSSVSVVGRRRGSADVVYEDREASSAAVVEIGLSKRTTWKEDEEGREKARRASRVVATSERLPQVVPRVFATWREVSKLKSRRRFRFRFSRFSTSLVFRLSPGHKLTYKNNCQATRTSCSQSSPFFPSPPPSPHHPPAELALHPTEWLPSRSPISSLPATSTAPTKKLARPRSVSSLPLVGTPLPKALNFPTTRRRRRRRNCCGIRRGSCLSRDSRGVVSIWE
jgi:hypothetical protein